MPTLLSDPATALAYAAEDAPFLLVRTRVLRAADQDVLHALLLDHPLRDEPSRPEQILDTLGFHHLEEAIEVAELLATSDGVRTGRVRVKVLRTDDTAGGTR